MCLFTDGYDFCSVVGELLFRRLLGQIKGHTHRSSCGRHEPALPKRLAWRGRGAGTEKPSAYDVAFHFFLLSLSWLKALFKEI